MELHFRTGEERCPLMGAAATLPLPASDPDGLWRRAAKERIRERILREEAEALALEFEVWRELMEERASLLARLAGGSETRAAPTVPSLKTAPIDHQCVQVGSKVDVSAAVPANKRKTPHVAAASVVSAATGSKKQKPDLTCTVCNITAASEFSLKVNGSPALPTKGGHPGVVVASMALAEKSCNNLGLNCMVCGITTSSQKNMQDHLKGKIHMRKTAMLAQPYPKENGCCTCSKPNASAAVLPAKRKNSNVVPASSTLSAGPSSKNQKQDLTCTATSEKGMQDHLKGKARMNMTASLAVGACRNGSGSETVPMEANGVRRLDGGILLCELCDVKAPSECVMRTHLSGRKHTNKQKAAADAGAGQEVKKAAAAATIGSPSKVAASIAVNSSDDSMKKPATGEMEVVVSSATPQVDVAAPVCARVSSMAPMEVDEGAAKAEEQEKADALEEGAVAIDGGPAVTGEEYYIKAEGKLFVTLRQADGSLSCGLCAVHGCDKRGMINHIYTRDHWRRACLAEEKRASEALPEAVNKEGDGISVTDGEAHVDN
ncbi:hypothetical protein VPH35_010511 [Triticum aestivum]